MGLRAGMAHIGLARPGNGGKVNGGVGLFVAAAEFIDVA
jgi:hypothetical protein